MHTSATYWAEYIFKYHSLFRFWPDLSMVKNHFKDEIILVSRSGFGSSSKLNQFFLATHPTCPSSFIRIRPQLFEISCYISFLACQRWRITLKIPVVGSRSSPKSNHFVLVTHWTWTQNFIRIHPQLFEISCTQTKKTTDKQTDRQKGVKT